MATTDIQFGQSTITYPTSGLVAQPVKYSVDASGNGGALNQAASGRFFNAYLTSITS